jgi:hypothetical protein
MRDRVALIPGGRDWHQAQVAPGTGCTRDRLQQAQVAKRLAVRHGTSFRRRKEVVLILFEESPLFASSKKREPPVAELLRLALEKT